MSTTQESAFKCRSASVHFIYSFAFSDPDKSILSLDNLEKAHRKLLKRGRPPSRKGIPPHLLLKQNLLWREGAHLKNVDVSTRSKRREGERVNDVDVRSLSVDINALFRIFPIGATCSINVETRRATGAELDVEEVLILLGLVEQRETNSQHTCTIRSEAVTRGKGRDYLSLNELFREQLTQLAEQLDVEWLDVGYTEKNDDAQSPWVVTVLEVDGDRAEAFCGWFPKAEHPADAKAKRIRPYHQDIARILFRSVSGMNFYLEPAYLSYSSGGTAPIFDSVNLDARLFVCISTRSILCICRDGVDPALYFVPEVLDVYELIRSQWHMLVIMNKMLDDALSLVQDPNQSTEARLEEIVKVRTWLARILEDPGAYMVSGDALTRIYNESQKSLRMAELRERLMDKIELLERMFRDLVDLDWMKIIPKR